MLTPISRREWNADAAAHLLARAGFGGTPEEVDRLAGLTLDQAVASLVDFERVTETVSPPAWATAPEADARPRLRELKELPEAERRARADAYRRQQLEQMQALRAWWIARMRVSPRPLQEKLTLFWHGHFTSGVRKVRSAFAMYRQNQTFRRLAAGNWATLVLEAAREPAMLIYLDNAQSRAAAPNENFARELMELFTLGEGHYTEADIQAAARAFTGWSLERDRMAFRLRPMAHDAGSKSFMGKQGALTGEDVIATILEQPQAAAFITRKLWSFFAYEDPEPELVAALATALRRQHYELRPLLKTMFTSAAFYGPRARRTQIKSPVQWLVGTLKAGDLDAPPAAIGARMLRRLGQDLFEPPNVKGWDGGQSWINAASLVDRYNGAALLVTGRGGGDFGGERMLAGVDGARVLPDGQRGTREQAQRHLQRRVYGETVSRETEQAIHEVLAAMPAPATWTQDHVRDVMRFMMCTPQYQLT